jgi:hypothetical protein
MLLRLIMICLAVMLVLGPVAYAHEGEDDGAHHGPQAQEQDAPGVGGPVFLALGVGVLLAAGTVALVGIGRSRES